jgi:uncharacterized protein YlxW (UPF0749 family)
MEVILFKNDTFQSAREALQVQLAEFQASCEQLQRDKRELEESLNAVNREQLARDAELSVLRVCCLYIDWELCNMNYD